MYPYLIQVYKSQVFYLWCNLCCMFVIQTLYIVFQTPLGFLSLLDEESRFPRGTDLTFLEKVLLILNLLFFSIILCLLFTSP